PDLPGELHQARAGRRRAGQPLSADLRDRRVPLRVLRLLPGGMPRGGDPRGRALRELGVLAGPVRVRPRAAVRANAPRLDPVGSLRPEGRVGRGRDPGHLLGVRRTGHPERPVLHHASQSRGQRPVAGRHAVLARGAVRPARCAVHRRAPGAGIRRRHHGAVPVRDHAAQSRPAGTHGPEGSGGPGGRRAARRAPPRAAARAAPGGAAPGDGARAGGRGARRGGAGDGAGRGAAVVRRLPRALRDHEHPAARRDRRRRRARQAEALMLLGPSLAVSAVLFALGVAGVLLRRNAIVIFMCVELMLNAVNLTFVGLAQQLGVAGQIFVFFVMAVAAAEAGVGLDHARDLPPPADGQSAEHQPAQGLMPAPPLSLLWVVPALPLAGFVVNGALALTRPTARRAVSIVGVGTLALAFAAAALAVAELARQHATAPLVLHYWEWLPV